MQEYAIKEISNGWILHGWIMEKSSTRINRFKEEEIFLPTIHAVADILTTWQSHGYIKAVCREEVDWRASRIEEEIADVEIMMAQMRLIFDTKRISRIKAKKLKRLQRRLETW